MADVVRILGLDDDNHAPMFRLETGESYRGPLEIIKWLAHAHNVEYDIRLFSIVGERSGTLLDLSEEEINEVFEKVEGIAEYSHLDFNGCFDILWESANKWWW